MNAKVTLGVVITAVALSAGAGAGRAMADEGSGLEVGRSNPSAPLVGTLLEMTSNRSFQARQRSADVGYWERTDRACCRAVFNAFVQFDTAKPVPPPGQPVLAVLPLGIGQFERPRQADTRDARLELGRANSRRRPTNMR